jgi:hypothetical protein
VLLDIFSFGAIYAPTAEIGGFVVDDDVKHECARYIRVPRLRIGSDVKPAVRESKESISSSASHTDDTPSRKPSVEESDEEWNVPHTTLIHLYTSLRQGLTLKNWVLANLDNLHGIDVRRLITFGIIKGFLYRVHKYAIATTSALPPAPPTSLATSTANLRMEEDTVTVKGGAGGHHPSQGNMHAHRPSFSLHRPSVAQQFGSQPKADEVVDINEGIRENALPMLRFLDGMHSFDEICTELALPERTVEGKVRGMGEGLGVIVQR